MSDKTIEERMARYNEHAAKEGIVRCEVRIPEYRRPELLKLAEKWRREAREKKPRKKRGAKGKGSVALPAFRVRGKGKGR